MLQFPLHMIYIVLAKFLRIKLAHSISANFLEHTLSRAILCVSWLQKDLVATWLSRKNYRGDATAMLVSSEFFTKPISRQSTIALSKTLT